MSGHGLGWFAVDWRQMWEKKQQRTGGVIWVSLTWGETSQSKQRGPLSEASRDPHPSHVSSLWRLPTAKKTVILGVIQRTCGSRLGLYLDSLFFFIKTLLHLHEGNHLKKL